MRFCWCRHKSRFKDPQKQHKAVCIIVQRLKEQVNFNKVIKIRRKAGVDVKMLSLKSQRGTT